jgi:hypothetical protein
VSRRRRPPPQRRAPAGDARTRNRVPEATERGTGQSDPAPADTRSPPGRARRLKQALAAAGAFVALLAGLASVFDWLERKVDDPPKPRPTPPATIDARIEMARLQLPNERLIDYMRDTGQDATDVPAAERRERGLRFAVRVRLRGLRGVPMPLRWQMYDQGSGRRLRGRIYNQIPVTFTPANADHARTVPIWVPKPQRPGTYTVRFSLLDRRMQPLDDVTSPDFSVDGRAASAAGLP